MLAEANSVLKGTEKGRYQGQPDSQHYSSLVLTGLPEQDSQHLLIYSTDITRESHCFFSSTNM